MGRDSNHELKARGRDQFQKRLIAHLLLPVLLSFCSPSLVPGQPPTKAASLQRESEAQLRRIVDEFFEAFSRKDLDRVMDLWYPRSPERAGRKQQMQQQFAAYDRIEIKDVTLSKIDVEETKASARITFEMGAVDAHNGKPAAGLGKQTRTMRFVKDGDLFKIWSYVSAVSELAEGLIAAKTELEREPLLSTEKDLVTVELRRELIGRANALRLNGDYAHAIDVYHIAQAVSEQIGDREGVAWSLANLGVVQIAKADYASALDYLGRALSEHQRLGNQQGAAYALKYMGDAHNLVGNEAEALDSYRKSLPLWETTGDRVGEAYTLVAIGRVSDQRGDYAQALNYYRRSLTIQEQIGNKDGIAAALASIGYVYGRQGDFGEALEYFQKDLAICESTSRKPGIVQALINIGGAYLGEGNYARALHYYGSGLNLYESLGDRAGMATALNYIGIIHRIQGDYDLARDFLERSLALHEKVGNKLGRATVQNSIGNLQYVKGDFSAAIVSYQKSQTLYEQASDKGGVAVELDNVAGVLISLGKYPDAVEYLEKSLSLTESLGAKDGTARSLRRLAFARELQGSHSEALQLADRASVIAKQIGSLEGYWPARLAAGKANRALNRPEDARKAIEESIDTIEDLRTYVAGGEVEEQRYFEDKLQPYQLMVDLLVSQSNASEALQYSERAKARVLLDVIKSGKSNIVGAMTDDEREHEQIITNRLVSLNAQIQHERMLARVDAARVADLTAELQKARLDRESFEAGLYARHPELKVRRGDALPASLDEIKSLLDSRTALLEYMVTEDRTYLFVLTLKSNAGSVDLRVYSCEINGKSLADLVNQFRGRLANRDFGFAQTARTLYDILVKPAESQLSGKTAFVLVPDAVLWNLPFQALQNVAGRYLIEAGAVSYAPSITVLREIKRHRKPTEADNSSVLLAIGNPSLGNHNTQRGDSTLFGENLDPLPEAERQAKSLGELYGAAHSKVYVGADAREDSFKAEGKKYRILQLATHGVLNDASPLYSYLVLSTPSAGSKEDGLLEAWEIMRMNLDADLVVLTGCETALGRIGAGEGVIGLSWALFVAGCPTTVVSQWKVESASTTDLMLAFHRGLKPALSPKSAHLGVAEALRKAALKLMKSDHYAHPFFWAGFVVVGDGD